MKQKLFLLMVLMVGLVACSKDEDDSDNLQIDIYKSDNLNNLGMGEFVGDWILNNKKIETDTLSVMDNHFFVQAPSVPLIKYAANELINNSLILPDNEYNGETDQSDYTAASFNYVKVEAAYGSHIWPYENQGYSYNNAYFNVEGLKNYVTQTDYIIANGLVYYYGDNKSYNLSICTNQPMVAVFNKDTHLWTLKMTLTKINYHISGVDGENTMDLQSPAELLFVATKKLGNTETD